jgi:hypothetical protein
MGRRPGGEPAVDDYVLRRTKAKNYKKKGKFFFLATPVKGGVSAPLTPRRKRNRVCPDTPSTPLGRDHEGAGGPGPDYEDFYSLPASRVRSLLIDT